MRTPEVTASGNELEPRCCARKLFGGTRFEVVARAPFPPICSRSSHAAHLGQCVESALTRHMRTERSTTRDSANDGAAGLCERAFVGHELKG